MKFQPHFQILSVAFLLLVFSANAQVSPTRAQIEEDISHFRFRQASQEIAGLNEASWKAYYQANLLIYQYLGTQQQSYREKLDQRWKKILSPLEARSQQDTLREILLSDLHCKRAVLAFLDQEYLRAVGFARTGRKYIQQSQKKYGDHIEQMKIRGLFNVMLGAVPRKYLWITQSLGFKGNIDEGLHQLDLAASKSKILWLESLLLACFIEKNMLNRTPMAIQKLVRTRRQTGPNLLLDFVLASGYMSLKQNDKALDILSQREQYTRPGIFFIPYWDYLLGKAYYYQGSQRQAQKYLARFVNAFQGKIFRSDAYFRLGMSLTLNGSYAVGRQFFQLIATQETEGLDEDEYARRMALKFALTQPSTVEMTLFRARNFYDGGYMKQAIQSLQSIEKHSLSQPARTELHYRYGRIYHTQGKYPLAIRHYSQCTDINSDPSLSWLQVYAWYYRGEINWELGQLDEAKSHFEKALAFDGYDYQQGLENRCKVALERVKKRLKLQASANKR